MSNPLVPELDCTDLDASLHFYVDVLGFTILYSRPEDKFVYLEREGCELMLEQIGASRNWHTGALEYPFGRGVNFQIQVRDIESLYDRVKSTGHPIFAEMEEKWYRRNDTLLGNRQFLVQDRDGYLLRFFQNLGSKSLGSNE